MIEINEFLRDTRGQAHTTEAILASLLILAGVLFAVQTPAVTPLSSATEDKHLENQQRESVRNILSITHENGALKDSVLYWNTTTNSYQGTADDVQYYTDRGSDSPLLSELESSLDTNQIVYNVNVKYYNVSDSGTTIQSQRLLHVGAPSNNAVTARKTLTLHETDALTTNQTMLRNTSTDEFYMYNVSDSSPVYNQVEVEVIAWRR